MFVAASLFLPKPAFAQVTPYAIERSDVLKVESQSPDKEHTPSHRGKIALSFDDAPRGNGAYFTGAERTEALITSLESVNAPPVVFFVTTQGLKSSEGRDRISKYAKAGHLIANHSDTHPFASQVGLEATILDIDSAEQKLAGYSNRRPWFRFPYLDEGKTLDLRDGMRSALKERDLLNGYVTIDNFDWYLASQWRKAVRDEYNVDMEALKAAYIETLVDAVEFYDQLAIDAIGNAPPHVLLLHENDLAALFIDDLIKALRQQGWEIISPDEAYAHPVATTLPETLNAGSGLFAAMAIDRGYPEKRLQNPAIDESAIDALLNERHVFTQQR